MSWLLELSCNLTGESQLFYQLGLTWLSGTNPTARLSLAWKKNRAGSGGSTPSWLELLSCRNTRLVGVIGKQSDYL